MKEKDIPMHKREIRNLIFMQFYFGGLSILVNYPKTHSFLFLGVVSTIILLISIWGFFISANQKINRAILFIYKFVTFIAVSGYFLSISFTSYYVYLGLKDIVFPLMIFFIYTLIIFITYKIYSKLLINNKKQEKQKFLVEIGLSFGSIGYLLGLFLTKKMNQVDMHIILIVLSVLVSCTFIMVGTINILKYKISKALA